ncbi:MAG: YitT family protein [Eubacteriales bacterium]
MELQNKRNIAKNIFLDILCFTLGGILYGISVSVFSEPNQIAPGGVTGISIILNSLIHTPVGTMALILNAPLIIWAIVELGYKLVVKTIFAIILTSISIDVIAMFIPSVSRGSNVGCYFCRRNGGRGFGAYLYSRWYHRRNGYGSQIAGKTFSPFLNGKINDVH